MSVVFAADVIVVKRRDFEESPNPSYPNDKVPICCKQTEHVHKLHDIPTTTHSTRPQIHY